jgi:AcrR family transcriptional regulator
MAKSDVTPNRRGVRSRELVLDAAERVMAEHGYEATSIARVVEEAGIPISSVYHYFGSKEGILLAVMERGAERFFAELPRPGRSIGPAPEHMRAVIAVLIDVLSLHPSFLRLLLVFATQPETIDNPEVRAVVNRVRAMSIERIGEQLGYAYGDDPRDPVTVQMSRFLLAAVDGAFIAIQADPDASLDSVLMPMASSIASIRQTLREAA